MVITGNFQVTTLAAVEDDVLSTLIDLERDSANWMRRVLVGHAEISRQPSSTSGKRGAQVEHERQRSSPEYNKAFAAAAAGIHTELDKFSRERDRLLSRFDLQAGRGRWSHGFERRLGLRRGLDADETTQVTRRCVQDR